MNISRFNKDNNLLISLIDVDHGLKMSKKNKIQNQNGNKLLLM
jgi:hypothetical protein